MSRRGELFLHTLPQRNFHTTGLLFTCRPLFGGFTCFSLSSNFKNVFVTKRREKNIQSTAKR